MDNDTNTLILDLFSIQAVKFGDFTLKSGIQSPIYIDLRVIVSYPLILKKISNALWKIIQPLSYDMICGVPYTALPIATCLSVQHDIPMVMRRKESKGYGTQQNVEGVYHAGQKCLIIEDVITSGASILETTEPLQRKDLVVTDAIVVLNRQQGGEKKLAEQGLKLHSLLTINDLLTVLQAAKKIPKDTVDSVKKFLADNS